MCLGGWGGVEDVCVFGVCPQPQLGLGAVKGVSSSPGGGKSPGSHSPLELTVVSNPMAVFRGM